MDNCPTPWLIWYGATGRLLWIAFISVGTSQRRVAFVLSRWLATAVIVVGRAQGWFAGSPVRLTRVGESSWYARSLCGVGRASNGLPSGTASHPE